MWNSEQIVTDKTGTYEVPTIITQDETLFPPFDVVAPSLPSIANTLGIEEIKDEITIHAETISEEHNVFSNTNLTNESYNPIDVKLSTTGTYIIVARKKVLDKEININRKIIAQIVSIPHTLHVNGVGEVKTVLSTHLLVDIQHREAKMAEYVILGAIKEGYNRHMNMAYHWITKARGKSAIGSYAWYRPLNLSTAKRYGYDLEKNADYSLQTVEGYTFSVSEVKDFADFKSESGVRLQPSDDELKALQNVINFYTIRYNPLGNSDTEVIVGIVGYRSFCIVKHKLKLKFYPVQLCYFDVLKEHTLSATTQLLNDLKKKKVVAIHGIFMSNLSTIANKLVLSFTSRMIVDFYNFAHGGLNNTHIALLYV